MPQPLFAHSIVHISAPVRTLAIFAVTAMIGIFGNATAFAQNDAAANARGGAAEDDEPLPKVNAKMIGYFLGISTGQQMRGNRLTAADFDRDEFIRGLNAGLSADDPELSDRELFATQRAIETVIGKRVEAEAAKRLAEGKKYLGKIAATEGVKKLEGGLLYKELVDGDSDETPAVTDTVSVHYTGKFVDGTEFDSSRLLGEPAKFRLNGVIKGWTLALQKMNPGDKWMLYVPPQLAYGAMGKQGIPPNATLIFEVELLEIQ